MKFSYLKFATFGLLGLAGFFAMSCGSDQQGGVSEPRVYQPTSGVTQLEASIDGLDELRFVLLNDQQTDTMLTFTTTNGYFDVTLERIPADEIYFLEIRGQAAGYEEQGGVEWREIVPIFARDGATLQLAATPNDTTASLSKLDFFIEGGGEEQDFIQSWHDTYIQKRDELDDQITHEFVLGGRQVRSQRNARDEAQAQLDNITREYIEQGKPLASTMFLISQGNDHRSKVEEYSSLYENANSEVRDTKYGIDLNNRLHRITQYNPNLDFKNLLAARNSQLLPFQVK